MKRADETARLMTEKARATEQENLALAKKASEAEAEFHRVSMAHIKVFVYHSYLVN